MSRSSPVTMPIVFAVLDWADKYRDKNKVPLSRHLLQEIIMGQIAQAINKVEAEVSGLRTDKSGLIAENKALVDNNNALMRKNEELAKALENAGNVPAPTLKTPAGVPIDSEDLAAMDKLMRDQGVIPPPPPPSPPTA